MEFGLSCDSCECWTPNNWLKSGPDVATHLTAPVSSAANTCARRDVSRKGIRRTAETRFLNEAAGGSAAVPRARGWGGVPASNPSVGERKPARKRTTIGDVSSPRRAIIARPAIGAITASLPRCGYFRSEWALEKQDAPLCFGF